MAKFIESLDYSDPNATMAQDEWLGRPPDYDEAAITEVFEADVVVCGGGLAGVAAMRAASEEGATVILLEKCAHIQARSAQFAALGSKYMARWGRDGTEKRNEIVNELMRCGNYFPNQRTLNYWADNSGEALDWYIDALPNVRVIDEIIDIKKKPEGFTNWLEPLRWPDLTQSEIKKELFPTYQITMNLSPNHANFLQASHDKAMGTGLCREFFCMPAKKLLQDTEGRVTGVIAEGFDGRAIKAKAKKGVVLATGDYAGNHDMLYYYCPWVRRNNRQFVTGVDPAGYHANTGDGHRMAMWIGAKMEDCPHAPITHHMGGLAGASPYLHLNINGERYINEDCGGQELDNQLKTLPQNMSWQILDSKYKEQLQYMAQRHGMPQLNPDGSIHASVKELYKPGSILMQTDVLTADTIDKLVALTDMPAETALSSIRRYNELARRGVDEDFGKAASRMFPIEEPPFYALNYSPTFLLNCVSGIECDHNTRCYTNPDRRIIPGLYVAGNVQGGRFSGGYPTIVPGLSHSMCLTFGRLSGKNAATGI